MGKCDISLPRDLHFIGRRRRKQNKMGEVIIIVPQHYTTMPQKQTKKNYHRAIV
jgi:hypothetical protein